MGLKPLTVQIPSSKIVVRKSGKYKYVYYILRAYRNAKGQPTSDTVCIGKIDPDNNALMIPNNRYYDYFDTTDNINQLRNPKSILNYGTYFVLNEIANKVGLTKIMQEVFGETYYRLLLISYYTLCEGNVMSYIDDWCETTYNEKSIVLTSQYVSKLISSISLDKKMEFFKKWCKQIQEKEYIAYDVTSISSYSTNINSVEWGYNRDNEDLPQINLGMFYGEESKLPIYYNSYYGSITDKEHLIYMMENTKALGIKDVKFVMDKGFYKKDNLNYMVDNNYPFIICLSNNIKYAKVMIDEARKMVNSSKYILETNSNYYGIILPKTQEKILYNVHVIYNEEKVADENSILMNRVNAYEKELSKMKDIPMKYAKYERFFKITINEDKTFTYEKDYEKIDKERSYSGYIVFLTTDLKITTDKLLKVYRNKDVIEKAFDNLKNELDLKRMRIHSDEAWSGKMFITFISLIIRSYIEKKKVNEEKTKNVTIKKIIKELEKIKMVTYYDEYQLLNPLTSLQKLILKALEIDVNKLKNIG